MSMNVKDVIKWLQTLSSDDAIYIDEGGLSLVSEKDGEAYLEVGGQPLEETEDDEEDDEIFEDEEEDENFEDIDEDEDDYDDEDEDDDNWPTEED